MTRVCVRVCVSTIATWIESIDGVRGKGKRGSRGGTKTHGKSVLAFRAADSTPMASGRRFQHSNGSVEDNMRGNSQEPPAAASLVPSGGVHTYV